MSTRTRARLRLENPLSTRPAEIYRALVKPTALGARMIVDRPGAGLYPVMKELLAIRDTVWQ